MKYGGVSSRRDAAASPLTTFNREDGRPSGAQVLRRGSSIREAAGLAPA